MHGRVFNGGLFKFVDSVVDLFMPTMSVETKNPNMHLRCLNLKYVVAVAHRYHMSPYCTNFRFQRLFKLFSNFCYRPFRIHITPNSGGMFQFLINSIYKILAFQVHLVKKQQNLLYFLMSLPFQKLFLFNSIETTLNAEI